MNSISVTDAFGNAPPRSPCVLCVPKPVGGTDMVLVESFSWLNIKRNTMLCFSLLRDAPFGRDLREGEPFVLAFPPENLARGYKQGLRLTAEDLEKKPGFLKPDALPAAIPRGSAVALSCTLAGAYNYPFKKVRIFNCNLEDALGEPED